MLSLRIEPCGGCAVQVCLEILSFAQKVPQAGEEEEGGRGQGQGGGGQERLIWRNLINQALRHGGVPEACEAVRRMGPTLYARSPSLPLDDICLLLELGKQVHRRSVD